MLSILCANVPRTNTASQSRLSYEDGQSFQEFHGSSADYLMTHTLPPSTTKTFFAPPLHHHMYQVEYFRIVSGKGLFHLSGKQITVEKDKVITIPVGAYHRFENGSTTEPLVVDITLTPPERAKEERFFRNFFGYLEDCRKAKMEPSLFQLLRFLHAVDGPLALPVPAPVWVRHWIDWAFMMVGGVMIGEWLLGYQESYKEYYKGETD